MRYGWKWWMQSHIVGAFKVFNACLWLLATLGKSDTAMGEVLLRPTDYLDMSMLVL